MSLLSDTNLGLMVIGIEIGIERLDNLKGTSQKKVNVSASEFDGRMDPNAFSDWLVSIEEYFDWYEMIDSERVRFATMKLNNSTKMYWQNVLQDMFRLSEPPITKWADMKAKLQEKYIPPSYKSQLFSTIINLK